MASELYSVPDDLALDATIRSLDCRQTVFGRYVLKEVLGRGGMGVVWLARDERLERDVALKFLPEEVYFDPGALDELKRETRRCLDLTHPNIIRIYDFAKDEQAAAISMEYVDGKTLTALRIEREQRVFELSDVSRWIGQACQALAYAHEDVGVVHRDLKPANLMLTCRGQIKVADFGIAQSMGESVSRITMRRGTGGTLAYMSPQQLNGDTPRASDDVYAMGTTIYEMLTSKPPFFSGDIPFQARISLPRPMSERRRELGIAGEEIPREWEELVAACLAKSPSERPGSMRELGTLLENANSVRAVAPDRPLRQNKPPGLPLPVPKQRPPSDSLLKNRLAQVAAGLVVAALVLACVAFQSARKTPVRLGALAVASNPPGAIVQIVGQPGQQTPCTYTAIPAGHVKVTVSLENYEPIEQDVVVTPDMKLDLGTVQLHRTLGSVDLAAVPLHAHYELSGGVETGGFHKLGTTPDYLPSVPAGTYQLTFTASNFTPYHGSIKVTPHDTCKEAADLTELAIENKASPDSAKVIRGEMDATRLEPGARAELTALYDKAFEQYFATGLLAPAAGELAKLKSLGENTDAQQARLDQKQAAAETDFATEIRALITAGKMATAAEKFKNLNGALGDESVNRLKQQFQAGLDDYQARIASAIKAAQSGPLSNAYTQLKTLAAQSPDDLDVELALADVQTQMPPDHEFLTTQIASFKQFIDENRDFAAEPTLIEKQAAFVNELQQLDTLTAALTAAKSGPAHIHNQIAALEDRRDTLESRRVGEPKGNPFTQTINFFGKAVTGHKVVDKEAYFSSSRAKREAIAAVQAEIDSDKLSLTQPQTTVADAQNAHDAFVAQVPWGQSQDAPASPAINAVDSAIPSLPPPPDAPLKL